MDKEIIIECLNHTWDIIGGDVLEAAGIRYDSAGSLRRSQVIEVVIDCLEVHNQKYKDQIAEFFKLSKWKKQQICKEAFPYKTYGY